MNNVYLVFANYESDVSYGVDNHTFLCGVYSDKESADKRVEELKRKIEEVKADLIKLDVNYIDYGDDIWMKAKEYIGFDVTPYDGFKNDWDVDFIILELPFGNIDECLHVGGANYAE